MVGQDSNFLKVMHIYRQLCGLCSITRPPANWSCIANHVRGQRKLIFYMVAVVYCGLSVRVPITWLRTIENGCEQKITWKAAILIVIESEAYGWMHVCRCIDVVCTVLGAQWWRCEPSAIHLLPSFPILHIISLLYHYFYFEYFSFAVCMLLSACACGPFPSSEPLLKYECWEQALGCIWWQPSTLT